MEVRVLSGTLAMRLLDTEEITWLKPMIEASVAEARKSPCQHSKRGVVIFKGERILGRGFNAPGSGRVCFGEGCEELCSLYAIHAERNAVQDALSRGFDLSGASFVHSRIKDGKLSSSDKITCEDCVPYLLRVQSRMRESFGEFILDYQGRFVALTIAEMQSEIR